MSETFDRPEKAGRPSTGEKFKFSAIQKKDGAVKEYYDQIASKGLKDPFNKYYKAEDGFSIIKPPLNPYALVKMIQENAFLTQSIDAMVTNVHGFGYRLEFVGKEDQETDPEALTELQHLEEMFEHPNTYSSFQEMTEKLAWDYYVFGNCYLEVTRDDKKRVITLHHIPAPTVRISKVENVSTTVVETLKRYGKDVKVKTSKQFRRFVQVDEMGAKVWFKEFGDPRTIDPKTGKENTGLAFENSATEIIHTAKYNGQSVYGIPNWYSQLPSIIGSRQAELTNLDFFENNGIPALAVLVSGGYLTEEAFDYLRTNFESVKGRGSTNKVLILEARGSVEDASQTGQVPTPTITMKPLGGERQNDALFQEYEKQARDKIRSSFRLPAVFTGNIDMTTYAAAKVAMEIAETQVFIPERNKFDDLINNKVLKEWNLSFWRFRTHPSAIVTSEDVISAIESFNKAGAMTPNVAIGMLNEKLNLDIPRVKEWWGDLPVEIVKAIMASQGSPDKTNFMIDALQALETVDVMSLKKVPVPQPASASKTKVKQSDEEDEVEQRDE